MIKTFINKQGKIEYYKLIIAISFALMLFDISSIKIFPGYSIYIIILFPFLLLSLYLFFFKIELSLLVYIALIPIFQHFSLYSLPAGDFLVAPHMVIQFFLFVGVFNNFIFSYNHNDKLDWNLVDKLFILFSILSISSLIFGYYLPTDSDKRWLLFYTGIFEPIAFYFVIKYFLYRDKEFLNKLLWVLIFTSFASLIIGYIEYKGSSFNLIELYLSRNKKGFGYHNMNLFGLQSAIIFPINFYMVFSEKFKKYKIYSITSLIILTLLSLLTLNRGTFIVIFIQLFLLFFIKKARKLVKIFLFFSGLAAIYFNKLILIYLFRFFSGSHGMLTDSSAVNRIYLWEIGLKTMFNYPLGIGADAFQYFWLKAGINTIFFGSPHNILLDIGVSYGIPALLVFILIFYKIFQYINFLIKHDNSLTDLYKCFRISIIGYILIGFITGGELSHLSGFMYPNNGYTLILMIIFGIIVFQYNKVKGQLVEEWKT